MPFFQIRVYQSIYSSSSVHFLLFNQLLSPFFPPLGFLSEHTNPPLVSNYSKEWVLLRGFRFKKWEICFTKKFHLFCVFLLPLQLISPANLTVTHIIHWRKSMIYYVYLFIITASKHSVILLLYSLTQVKGLSLVGWLYNNCFSSCQKKKKTPPPNSLKTIFFL